jgi:hypothetical protein
MKSDIWFIGHFFVSEITFFRDDKANKTHA